MVANATENDDDLGNADHETVGRALPPGRRFVPIRQPTNTPPWNAGL